MRRAARTARAWAAALGLGLSLPAPGACDQGETGAEFLKIMPSPRAVAMGEAGAALADDHLSALSLNPAGLGRLRYPEAAFLYNSWFEGISLQNLSYAHATEEWGTLGFSGTMLRVEPLEGFDDSGAPAGEVDARSLAFKLAYARHLGVSTDRRRGLFAGGAVKLVQEKLENASASTALWDLGVLYGRELGPGLLGAAAAVESLGQGLRFDSERDPAPTATRLGLAYTLPVLNEPLSLVWDLRKPIHEESTHGVGIEYTVLRTLAWRFGWVTNQDLGTGLRFGTGIKLKVMSIDYALAQFGRLGFTHRIALSARFGAPVERTPPSIDRTRERADWHLRKGNDFVREGRYYEAALEFNEVLVLDPHNQEALKNLRLMRELLERGR